MFSFISVSIALLVSAIAANGVEICHRAEVANFTICRKSDVLTAVHQTGRSPHLQLHSNTFSRIAPHAFRDVAVGKLSLLHPNSTQCTPKFVNVTSASFDGLRAVQKIILDCIKFPVKPNPFRKLKSLSNLWLTRVRLEDLYKTFFIDLPNLKRLTLIDVQLRIISPKLFTSFKTEKLEKLQIDDRIQFLEPNAFEKFPELSILELHYGNFSVLPEGVFDGIRNLYILNLTSNAIQELPLGVFRSLPELEHLLLNTNRISRIEVDTFWGLTILKELDLGNNYLERVPVPLCQHIGNLEKLNLRNNRIVRIEKNNFLKCSKLRTLDLGNNRIHQIGRAGFQYLKLQNLFLDHNNINVVGYHAFYGLNATSLNLQQNNITAIETKSLKMLTAGLVSMCYRQWITEEELVRWGIVGDSIKRIENTCGKVN